MWRFLRVTDRCDRKLERKQERNSADAELDLHEVLCNSWMLLSANHIVPLVNYFARYTIPKCRACQQGRSNLNRRNKRNERRRAPVKQNTNGEPNR